MSKTIEFEVTCDSSEDQFALMQDLRGALRGFDTEDAASYLEEMAEALQEEAARLREEQ